MNAFRRTFSFFFLFFSFSRKSLRATPVSHLKRENGIWTFNRWSARSFSWLPVAFARTRRLYPDCHEPRAFSHFLDKYPAVRLCAFALICSSFFPFLLLSFLQSQNSRKSKPRRSTWKNIRDNIVEVKHQASGFQPFFESCPVPVTHNFYYSKSGGSLQRPLTSRSKQVSKERDIHERKKLES